VYEQTRDGTQESVRTTVARTSPTEMTATRLFDSPLRRVYEAWRNPALFRQWWVPRSMNIELQACEMDVRTGGQYRLRYAQGFEFFGRYVEVIPDARIVWTNEEGGENGSTTTVFFEAIDGRTRVVLSERYPSPEALEAAGLDCLDATHETFAQLAELVAKGNFDAE